MRILFLSRWYPYPPNNGSKLRIWNLLRALGQRYEVTLVSFTDPAEEAPDVASLKDIIREVYTVPWREFNSGSLRALLGFFSPEPRWMVDTYSRPMADTISQVLASQKYDLVIASQLIMGSYAASFSGVPALLEEVELGVYFQKQQQASNFLKKIRHSLTLIKLKSYLRNLLQHFCGYTVVSEQERRLLNAITASDAHVRVIPNCIDLDNYKDVQASVKKDSLIYTGSFRYNANYEAMEWFTHEVFPRILAVIPTAQLVITGDSAGKSIGPDPHISQVGLVPDIRPWIASSMVSLAPLQTGGGTRLKILEAMALHSPVVATSKGAEGLDARSGEHFLVADSPQDFADAVIRLLKDEAFRASITQAAYRLVEERYNWQNVLLLFIELIEEIARNGHYGESLSTVRRIDD